MTKLSTLQLATAGVARISLGSANIREVQQVMHDTMIAILDNGDFSNLGQRLPSGLIDQLLEKGQK